MRALAHVNIMRLSSTATRWLIVALTCVLWEVAPRAGWIAELFLPPLTATLHAGIANYQQYGRELLVTLYEVAISMVLACGGGIIVGAVIGSVASLRILLLPLISTLYAVPLVIIYPLFVVWLGLGPPSKIAFASLIGFFPAALSTAAGIQTIDPQLLLAARKHGRDHLAAPHARAGARRDSDCAVGTAARRRVDHRRRGRVRDAGRLAGHRLPDLVHRQSLDSPHIYAGILLVLLLAVGFDAIVRCSIRARSGQ